MSDADQRRFEKAAGASSGEQLDTDEARQGQVVLKSPGRRWVFFGVVVAAFAVAAVVIMTMV